MKYMKNKLHIDSNSYSGVQVRQRNTTRINDIKLIQASLETYYAQSGFYPTLANLNSPTWTSNNLKALSPSILQDPSSKVNAPRFADSPTPNEYSYQPTASDGTSPCDNKTVACGKYTLSSTLEGSSGTFVEKSLN
jgi:type II secretory pathway pseudopilin PulG